MARVPGLVWPRARALDARPLLAQTAECSALPDGRRCPFGWPVARIDPGATLRVVWSDTTRVAGAALLRVTVALDDREEKLVDVRTAATDAPLGRLDVRFADPHQRFGLALDAAHARRAAEEGVAVRL